ncbi:MAG: FKBP-type peptidyl-prolyl cis-trans isomerase [Bacteroidales bacterium]|nr:FKBP-type peptidyl-prolyl cis-trans isomerase [Bacteroidales bacterium]
MQLNNDRDKVSFIIGEDMARSIMNEEMDVNVDIMIEAMRDKLAGKSSNMMTDDEKARVMHAWQHQMQHKQQERIERQSAENKKAGREFLANNRNQPNVIETPSGLQYTVMTEGSGNNPKPTDTVKVHYHGTLLDGTVFDSSVQRGQPISLPLNQVIAGWTEGLQTMKTGGKTRFFIPSDLAYGDQPVGDIPAGSTLIFEVELLAIE